MLLIIWEENECEGGWLNLEALAEHIEANERGWIICTEVVGNHGEDRSDELRAEIRRLRGMEPCAFDDPAHISGVNAFTGHAA